MAKGWWSHEPRAEHAGIHSNPESNDHQASETSIGALRILTVTSERGVGAEVREQKALNANWHSKQTLHVLT